jgi:aminomethyltransferase
MKKKGTALHDLHVELGARMMAFAGYHMPLQYEGILKEHSAVRRQAGIFDTCHMGELDVRGPGAEGDLERILSCRIGTLGIGQCRYGLLCNSSGGVTDDLLVYRLEPDHFMLVVNAAHREKDFAWLGANASHRTHLEDRSEETAKVDLQGPESPPVAEALLDRSIAGLRFYRCMQNRFLGEPVIVSRTGYTGEIGFEIYGAPALLCEFWRRSLARGVHPAGLGARDTLRLEMGFPLYGHELNEDRNAGESGFTKAIAVDKTFIGSDRVCNAEERRSVLTGIEFQGRRAARTDDWILASDGHEIGRITSGSLAPSLGHAVALGYVRKEHSVAGNAVHVQAARQELEGRVSRLPFYGGGTARMPMSEFLGTREAPS